VYQQLKEGSKLTGPIIRVAAVQSAALTELQNMQAQGRHKGILGCRRGALRTSIPRWTMGSRTAELTPSFRRSFHQVGILTNDSRNKTTGDGYSARQGRFPVGLSRHRRSRHSHRAGRFRGRRQGPTARATRRDRIEHAQVVAPMDFRSQRFAELHVIASMQPSHQTKRTCLGRGTHRARAHQCAPMAWATMLKNKVPSRFWARTTLWSPSAVSAGCTPASRAGDSPDCGPRKNGWSPGRKSRSRIASGPTPQDCAYAQV